MRWAIAAGYVAAATLFVAALTVRFDPRVLGRLSPSGAAPGSSPSRWVGRLIPAPRSRKRIADRLRDGARSADVDRVIGRKFLIGVAGALLGGTASTSPPMWVALVILFGLAGWRLPDFALARQARAVRARSQAAIPELLDLVAVSVTAGLTPRLALDRAGAALSGPLAAELEEARRSVDLGQSWAEVLRRTAERLDLRDLRRLSSTLERSARLGAPVAERLRGLAREVRAERRAREEERARRAPVTMLFPLVFLILPAFVLAAVVPTILVATRGIR